MERVKSKKQKYLFYGYPPLEVIRNKAKVEKQFKKTKCPARYKSYYANSILPRQREKKGGISANVEVWEVYNHISFRFKINKWTATGGKKEEYESGTHLLFQTTREIQPGEEILLDYGNDYWCPDDDPETLKVGEERTGNDNDTWVVSETVLEGKTIKVWKLKPEYPDNKNMSHNMSHFLTHCCGSWDGLGGGPGIGTQIATRPKAILETFQKWTADSSRKQSIRFCDLGCGVGHWVFAASILAPGGCHVGVDHCPNVLLQAETKINHLQQKIKDKYPDKKIGQTSLCHCDLSSESLSLEATIGTGFTHFFVAWTGMPPELRANIACLLKNYEPHRRKLVLVPVTHIHGEIKELFPESKILWSSKLMFGKTKMTVQCLELHNALDHNTLDQPD